MTNPCYAIIASSGLLLAGSPFTVTAHHAGIAYDHEKQITVTGIVKTFQWTNPHTWITVTVPNGKGGSDDWELEGTTVNTLVRAGWTKQTLQPGMKLKVLVSPRKDGTVGGEWNKVIAIDDVPFKPPVLDR